MLKKLKSRNFKNSNFGFGVITGIISTLLFQYLQQPVKLLLSNIVITVRQLEPLSLFIGILMGGLIVGIIAMMLMSIRKDSNYGESDDSDDEKDNSGDGKSDDSDDEKGNSGDGKSDDSDDEKGNSGDGKSDDSDDEKGNSGDGKSDDSDDQNDNSSNDKRNDRKDSVWRNLSNKDIGTLSMQVKEKQSGRKEEVKRTSSTTTSPKKEGRTWKAMD